MKSSLSLPKVPYSKDNTIRSHPTTVNAVNSIGTFFSTFTHITRIRGNNKSNQRRKKTRFFTSGKSKQVKIVLIS